MNWRYRIILQPGIGERLQVQRYCCFNTPIKGYVGTIPNFANEKEPKRNFLVLGKKT